VVCDCSSACFPNDYVSKPSELCVNSEALKYELKKTQDELKSAWLIIELLITEVNALKAASEASAISYQSGYNALDCRTETTNPAGSHKWIPVKSVHSNTVRRNLGKQSGNLITLTNSFEVLGNLYDSSDKATTNLQKAPKTSRVQKKRPNTSKKHSVILMGDSHTQGIAERLTLKLGPSFHTTGYVKPNATVNHMTSSVNSELRNLNKNDIVVLCGGSLDIARNYSKHWLASISRFVKNLEHTNVVVVVDAPHTFDLETSSCVNKEVIVFNRKLHKILKPHKYTTQINLIMERDHFTKHGLHMNGSGKDRLSGLLASEIIELFATQPTGTPITIPWKDKATDDKEKLMRPVSENSAITGPEQQIREELVKHTHCANQVIDKEQLIVLDSMDNAQPQSLRTSNRAKKIPATRNEDFLWPTYTSKTI